MGRETVHGTHSQTRKRSCRRAGDLGQCPQLPASHVCEFVTLYVTLALLLKYMDRTGTLRDIKARLARAQSAATDLGTAARQLPQWGTHGGSHGINTDNGTVRQRRDHHGPKLG